MQHIGRPIPGDAPSWCPYFFDLVKEDNLISAFQSNKQSMLELMKAVPPGREGYAYAENKWTTKMVLIHLTDTERFYAYRAFCSSRQVDVDLEFSPQRDRYALNSNAADRTIEDIAEEFAAAREATIQLFKTMTEAMLDFKGFPNKTVYTSRSLGWMAVGHTIHHMNILKEKYLE